MHQCMEESWTLVILLELGQSRERTAPFKDCLFSLRSPAMRQPIRVELEAGKTYFWCECGRSQSQPFCDGSHKGTPYEPKKFIAEKTEAKFLCACKDTENAPFCDGSHSR